MISTILEINQKSQKISSIIEYKLKNIFISSIIEAKNFMSAIQKKIIERTESIKLVNKIK